MGWRGAPDPVSQTLRRRSLVARSAGIQHVGGRFPVREPASELGSAGRLRLFEASKEFTDYRTAAKPAVHTNRLRSATTAVVESL
jgi:hypothetical protein